MKIALCFSGHPRTFEECFSNIKSNIIDKYDCDIFISTYKTTSEVEKKMIELYNPKKFFFNNEEDILDLVEKNNNKNIKFLKNYVFDNSNLDDSYYNRLFSIEEIFLYDKINCNDFTLDHKIHKAALCQFYGIYHVSKLCLDYINENQIKYDYIMRLRLDSKVSGDFHIKELEEDQVVVNCIPNYSDSLKVHDHFFLAKQDTYFKISDLYNNLTNIIDFINNNKCWLPASGYQETLLLIQIFLHKIRILSSKDEYTILKYTE